MLQTQSFRARSQGAIRSGSAHYSLDTITGKIRFDATVTGGVLFITKTASVPPTDYQVDPKDLVSENFRLVGAQLHIGPVTFTVIHIDQSAGSATVSIAIAGKDVRGTALIRTSGPLISIRNVVATTSVPILGKVVVEFDEVFFHRLTR